MVGTKSICGKMEFYRRINDKAYGRKRLMNFQTNLFGVLCFAWMAVTSWMLSPAHAQSTQTPKEQIAKTDNSRLANARKPQSAMPGPTVKIGLSLPLSGEAAPLALQFLAGAQLAIEDHNKISNKKIALVSADDGCDARIAALAVEELRKIKPLLITGLLCNSASYTFADKMQQSGVPLLIAGARSTRLLTDRDYRQWNNWQLATSDDAPNRLMAERLAERWKDTPFAVLDDGTTAGRFATDNFRTVMEEHGLKAQFYETLRTSPNNKYTLVRQLARSGIARVFIAASPQDVAGLARDAKALNVDLELATTEAARIIAFFSEQDRPPEGIIIPRPAPPIDPALAQNILARAVTRGTKAGDYVMRGYQAVQIAIAALGSTESETTANLSSKAYDTVLGAIAFDAKGARKDNPYRLYRWNGVRFVPLEPKAAN